MEEYCEEYRSKRVMRLVLLTPKRMALKMLLLLMLRYVVFES